MLSGKCGLIALVILCGVASAHASDGDEAHPLAELPLMVSEWSPRDTAVWATRQGLGAYAAAMEEAGVDGDLLLDLEDAELLELGVDSSLKRKQFHYSIERLRTHLNSLDHGELEFWTFRAANLYPFTLWTTAIMSMPRVTGIYAALFDSSGLFESLGEGGVTFWLKLIFWPQLIVAQQMGVFLDTNPIFVAAVWIWAVSTGVQDYTALSSAKKAQEGCVGSVVGGLCMQACCRMCWALIPALLLDLNIYLFMLAQLGLAVNAIISALSPKAKRS